MKFRPFPALSMNAIPRKKSGPRALSNPMSCHKHAGEECNAISQLARRRVAAVLACLKVLCPSADLDTRRELTSKILALAHGEEHPTHRKVITEAAVYEMLTRNSQCVLNQTGRCRCWCSPNNYVRN
jgi:hypothetical protein